MTSPGLDLDSIQALRDALDATAITGTPPVESVCDLEVPGDAGPLRARLFSPVPHPSSLVVFFHGGGWVCGSIKHTEWMCRSLAVASGSAVLSVSYRLAPENPFPAGLDDCYRSGEWAAANLHALGVTPGGRVALAGESAGANLAAAVCLLARDRSGPTISAQLLFYPVTDADFDRPSMIRNAEGHLLTLDAMRFFWGAYVNDVEEPPTLAAVLRAPSLAHLPPAIVITAEHDPLCDEGEAYALRMQQEGVPVTLRRYVAEHGFATVGAFDEVGAEAVAHAGGLLAKLLTPDR